MHEPLELLPWKRISRIVDRAKFSAGFPGGVRFAPPALLDKNTVASEPQAARIFSSFNLSANAKSPDNPDY